MNRNIFNLTQHVATDKQISAGVVEPVNKEKVIELITFNTIPTHKEIITRVKSLLELVKESGYNRVMIDGAPFLMGVLSLYMQSNGIEVLYACNDYFIKDPMVFGTMIVNDKVVDTFKVIS